MTLLYPKYVTVKNMLTMHGRRPLLQAMVLCSIGALFWIFLFMVFYRVLDYFQGIDVLGGFLASKLLAMILLTLFSILLFSSIVTALSTLFLSEELHLLYGLPLPQENIYWVKLAETTANSSWMVLLFSMPVFVSYGIVFRQGWLYYSMIALTMPALIVICGALGTAAAIGLVSAFPARRLKDVLVLLSLAAVAAMYVFFRFLRPERLVDPDVFITVIDYLASLDMPAAPFLPSQWMTDILAGLLFARGQTGFLFNLVLLWSTAGAAAVIVGWLFNALHFNTWSKAQEAAKAVITRTGVFERVFERLLSPLPPQAAALFAKDLRVFFRDTAQWSQLFILAAIIVIYLYNFSVLPIEKTPLPTRFFHNLVAFFNLGLAGFVIAAVAVRFGFPAVSMEGEAFWIIKASPLTVRRFIWCKFWMTFLLLSIIAQILIVCTNLLLQVDGRMMALSSLTIFGMTFGITSMSIGLGAVFPRFRYENVAQIPTGFGGLCYMIAAMLFIAVVVVLEALPMHLFMMADLSRRPLTTVQMFEAVASFGFVVLLCVSAFIVPLGWGITRLEASEEF